MSAIPAAVIAEVHARADGHCEACSGPLSAEGGVMHHRKLRSQGGKHEAVNLMELHHCCHNGHSGSIHSNVARSLRLHHLVSAYSDPADCAAVVCPDLLRMKA